MQQEARHRDADRRTSYVDGALTAADGIFSVVEHGRAAENVEAPGSIRDAEALDRVPPPYSVFTKHQKWFIIFMASWGGFFSPLSANIYFPALNTLAADLKVSNALINLTLTSYMIFQGLAPTVVADLADAAGRRPAYLLGFIVYIAANVGLALQNNYAALFVLRCLQSSGSSSTVALSSGVTADITIAAKRGTYMGFAAAGALLGPAIGPVLGGVLAQFLGWPSIFWFLAIMAVVYVVIFAIVFPETGRNVVGNGSVPPPPLNMSLLNYLGKRKLEREMIKLDRQGDDNTLRETTSRQQIKAAQAELASHRKLRWPNPLRTLRITFEKDVGLLLVYNSLVYTAFYDVATSVPTLYQEIYGFNDLQIGLSFLPYGLGCMLASILSGQLMDWNFRRIAKKNGIALDRHRGNDLRGVPIERVRLQVCFPLLYMGNAVILCYGWVLEKNAPLAVSLVFLFLVGLFLTGAFNVMSTMLVDLYPTSPSTATAANNLVRCLVGAAGTAVIIQMIAAMGRGWCFTFIALIVFVTSPMLWAVFIYGPKWREERMVRSEQLEKEKEICTGAATSHEVIKVEKEETALDI